MTRKRRIDTLAAALMASGLAFFGTADGFDLSDPAEPTDRDTPVAAPRLSPIAARGALHVQAAGVGLRDDRTGSAAAEIDRADVLIAIASTRLPASEPRRLLDMARARLARDGCEAALDDLVPACISTRRVPDRVVALRTLHHLKIAGTRLARNQADRADAALRSAQEALYDPAVDLPLGSARRLLGHARTALANGNDRAVKSALTEAGERLRLLRRLEEGGASDLRPAVSAIGQAFAHVQAGTTAEAGTAMGAAADHLESAAAGGSDSYTRDAVAGLLADLRAVGAAADPDSPGSERALRRLWLLTHALSERDIERQVPGSSSSVHDRVVREAAVETKHRVTVAQAKHDTGVDRHGVAAVIARTAEPLRGVRGLGSFADPVRVEWIEDELLRLADEWKTTPRPAALEFARLDLQRLVEYL